MFRLNLRIRLCRRFRLLELRERSLGGSRPPRDADGSVLVSFVLMACRDGNCILSVQNQKRCASSFYSNGVDLVVIVACHMNTNYGEGCFSDCKVGIWREAELESWDDEHKMGKVVFRDDGSSEKLGAEAIILSEYAQMSGEEGADTSSEQSYSSSDEDESSQGLGFLNSTTDFEQLSLLPTLKFEVILS